MSTQEFPSKNSTWDWDSSSCLSQYAANFLQSLYYSSRIRFKACMWPRALGPSESMTALISSRPELSTGAHSDLSFYSGPSFLLPLLLGTKPPNRASLCSHFPFGRNGRVLLARVSTHWLTQVA